MNILVNWKENFTKYLYRIAYVKEKSNRRNFPRPSCVSYLLDSIVASSSFVLFIYSFIFCRPCSIRCRAVVGEYKNIILILFYVEFWELSTKFNSFSSEWIRVFLVDFEQCSSSKLQILLQTALFLFKISDTSFEISQSLEFDFLGRCEWRTAIMDGR